MASAPAKSNLRSPRPKKPPYHTNPIRTSSTAPSAGLLSLLATIAGIQGAEAGPLTPNRNPLSFLYPFIDRDDINVPFVGTLHLNEKKGPVRPRAPSSTVKRHNVPDKYEQGSDGRWRKADGYTLYGSTICLDNCIPSGSSTTVGETVASTPSHSTTITATPTKDVLDVLPSGWRPSDEATRGRTTIILTLSLVLAFFICGMMVGCIFWRKKKRRRQKDPDLEMKLRQRRPDGQEETRAAADKESRVKAKIWARATARWKANARARQRDRRRHPVRGTLSTSSAVSLQDTRDNRDSSSIVPPRSSSIVSSRASSISRSRRLSNCSIISQGDIHIVQDDARSAISSPPELPESSDPPAYHQRQSRTNICVIPECSRNSDHGPNEPPLKCEHDQHLPSSNVSHSSLTEDRIPYPPPIVGAHVATDDKTILARMVGLASAPPSAEGDVGEGPSSPHVSAPVWQDEEIGSFPEIYRVDDSFDSAPPLPFPPPPSKGKMADFCDYPYSFEELGNEGGPSAPPFEEHISTPLDGPDIAPSAPPLDDNQWGEEEEIWSSAPAEASLDRDSVSDRASSHTQGQEGNTPSGSRLSLTLPQDGIPPIYRP